MDHPPGFSTPAHTWGQIDHQLVSLKMSQAAIEFDDRYAQRLRVRPWGNAWDTLAAKESDYIEWADEWTKRVFEIHAEVWEKQGKARTPDFVRAVLANALLPAIEAKVGVAKFEITMHAKRTRLAFNLTPLLQKLARDADRLKSEWCGRIEIAARELQLEQAKRSVQVVRPLGAGDGRERVSPEQEIHRSDLPGGRRNQAHGIAEGAMAETAFWRDLKACFRALHDEQLQDRNKAGLHAHWNSNPANGEPWDLGGGPDDIRTNFEWLAELAAVQLGQPGGRNAVFFWLDLLRAESPHYRRINSSHIVKGTETRWESGKIELVCKASADYCIKCETQELELKRRSRKKKAFVGHRSNERPSALTPEAILRGLVADLAKDGKLPTQHPSAQPSIGATNQTEDKERGTQPLVKKPERLFRSGDHAGVTIEARTSLKSWKDLEISFLSDERVQIFRNGAPAETLNYAEMGFRDRRNDKPNRAWATLRELAQARGIIRDTGTGGHRAKVEKRMQEIRKTLRSRFGISADPLPFVHGTVYQALFKIGCAPSFRT